MTFKPLILNHRELALSKAVVSPELGAATVLTNEVWDFVELALVRQKKEEAKFYWQQAREFYRVGSELPLRSAPLLLYYSYMNAAKALLTAKGIPYKPRHGVAKIPSVAGAKPKKGLPSGIEIQPKGVLPALISYYGELLC